MKTVIEMAHETLDRMPPDDHCNKPYWTATDEELERLVELVRADAIADEREACAKVCEHRIGGAVQSNGWWSGFKSAMKQCAAAIRARGNT